MEMSHGIVKTDKIKIKNIVSSRRFTVFLKISLKFIILRTLISCRLFCAIFFQKLEFCIASWLSFSRII